MGYVSRHIFKWFGLTLILLNDGEQLYNGFGNTSSTQPAQGFFLQCSQIVSRCHFWGTKITILSSTLRFCFVVSDLQQVRV